MSGCHATRRSSASALVVLMLAATAAYSSSENPGLNATASNGKPAPPGTQVVSQPGASENVTGAVAPTGPNWGYPANDGDWTTAARDYANTRYSPLAEIDTNNVGQLRDAWSFNDGVLHGHEARHS